jgi:hypothetical protein
MPFRMYDMGQNDATKEFVRALRVAVLGTNPWEKGAGHLFPDLDYYSTLHVSVNSTHKLSAGRSAPVEYQAGNLPFRPGRKIQLGTGVGPAQLIDFKAPESTF